MRVILTVDEEEAFDSLTENGVDEDLALAQIARVSDLSIEVEEDEESGTDEGEESEEEEEEDSEEDSDNEQIE